MISVSHQLLLKSGRDEQAMLVTLAGIIAALTMLIGEMHDLLSLIEELFGL